MIATLASLRTHWPLLRDFVGRDLKARYVGSAMGFFWSIVVPIVNLFVFMLVFQIFLAARWGDPTSTQQTIDAAVAEGRDYLIRFTPEGSGSTAETALIMLAGILVWAAFAETIGRATNSLIENSNLIQKVVFPSEILVPYLALSSLFNMLIGLPIVLFGVLFIGEAGIGLPLLAIPLLLLLQILFTIGLGWMLSVANVFLRDIYHMIGVGLMVWMFTTPIFYPAFLVASRKYFLTDDEHGPYLSMHWLLELNPMYWLINSWRQVLVFDRWPNWELLGRFGVLAVLTFLLGAWVFHKKRDRVPDLL